MRSSFRISASLSTTYFGKPPGLLAQELAQLEVRRQLGADVLGRHLDEPLGPCLPRIGADAIAVQATVAHLPERHQHEHVERRAPPPRAS